MYIAFVRTNFILWIEWSRFEMNWVLPIWKFGRPRTEVPKALSGTEGAEETLSDFWPASKDVVRCELKLKHLVSVEK